MTFNLLYAGSDEGPAWRRRQPAVRALFQHLAPDVAGTQEGLFPQLQDLAAALPAYDWIGLGREGGSRGEFMAVFFRRHRLQPLEFDHFWLSDTPNRAGSMTWGNSLPRMVTRVKFRDRCSGQEFYFFNTHLDHRSAESREKAGLLIRQRVEVLGNALPIILGGDFNAAAGGDPVYDLLTAPGAFTDSWQMARERGVTLGTRHQYLDPIPDGPRIDWILCRGNIDVFQTGIETFSLDGLYPSDHFPVTARLVFR